jgi:hypothetical protein
VTLAIERRHAAAIRSARLLGLAQVGGAWSCQRRRDDDRAREHAARPGPGDRSPARRPGRAMRRLVGVDVPRLVHARRFALALCDHGCASACRRGRPPGRSALGGQGLRAGAPPPRHGRRAGRSRERDEELCVLLGDARTLRPGAVWIADRIGAFIAIAAVARGASALVAGDTVSPAAIAIPRAARLTTVSDVPGLFGWVRPDDLLAVDGDTGTILVHPAPADIERVRHAAR